MINKSERLSDYLMENIKKGRDETSNGDVKEFT